MFYLWPPATLVFLKFRIGAFQILSFRLGLLILNSPILGSTFHEYHGELKRKSVLPPPPAAHCQASEGERVSERGLGPSALKG